MSRRRRRALDVSNMAFLDVVSCGFGAVILLLVLTLELEPATIANLLNNLFTQAEVEADNRESLLERSEQVRQQQLTAKAQLVAVQQRIVELEGELGLAARAADDALKLKRSREQASDAMETVRQKLSEETQRLLGEAAKAPQPADAPIGGIPMDSEYIVFIIDTSGSMLRYAWPLVNQKVRDVLAVYPKVKGLQVVNDMGKHMFSAYQGRWIPDTPARRREVLRRLRTWQSFSNSSPVEGVVFAVRQFFSEEHKVSLYVFGDDFAGGSIDAVLREVHRTNARRGGGEPRVRVHAFGFPVLFLREDAKANRTRFAHLMRLLAEQNAGSFVGLPTLAPPRTRR